VLRWVNLALAIVLAALLLTELTRSKEGAPPVSTISTSTPVVMQETPGRRSRRLEARMAMEEAMRRQRERRDIPPGPVELDERGFPIRD
jgi:hypothetical protein